MSDVDVAEAELPLENVGARLLRAREAAGLSRAQIAGITRIPERHLAAIEAGDFAALPARTYVVGFSRSYAKALGLDAAAVVAEVQTELARLERDEPRRNVQSFEPGDPARVPGPRLVWLAGLGIVAVLIAVFFLARSMIAPGMTLPSTLAEEVATPAAIEAPAAAPALPATDLVVFTALEPKVWVKFTDGAGNQLFQKELAQGETWQVPVDQPDVRIATARPDALSITIGGQPVARLSEAQKSIRDVPVTAAALRARGTPELNPALQAGPEAAATQPRSPAPARQRRNIADSAPVAPGQQGPVPLAAPSTDAPSGAAPAAPAI